MYGAVHPHGRGDNRCQELVETAQHGSPPRAWGQCSARHSAVKTSRFTPTGVGTMSDTRWARLSASVHPHGRGDNCETPRRHAMSVGSPPRAWGQLRTRRPKHEHARFTPTGVGTMLPSAVSCDPAPVHPHGRGDNFVVRTPALDGDGSPPRAWGQCSARSPSHGCRQRFTPTGVGTMLARQRRTRVYAVHPHGRGDNLVWGAALQTRRGSPPRAWGQLPRRQRPPAATRFTPTGVGTMPRTPVCIAAAMVHPHGRGDNRAVGDVDSPPHGSPPRAWGQCCAYLRFAGTGRFTPTGVGTIISRAAKETISTVHPHGRGDNVAARAAGAFVIGSPPRAWGQYDQIRER